MSETLTIVIVFSPRFVVLMHEGFSCFGAKKSDILASGLPCRAWSAKSWVIWSYFCTFHVYLVRVATLKKNKCIRAYLCNYHQRRPKSVNSAVLLRMISWAAAVLLAGHGISNAVKKMARTLPIRGLKALRHVHKVFRLQVFMMEKASLYQTQHERERTCCAAIPSLHVFLRVYNRMICFF